MGARGRIKRWIGLALLATLAGGGCMREIAQMHMARGDVALDEKDLNAALAEFQRAVKLDPQRAEAHSKLGMAYKQKGDLDSAADALEDAVRLDPFHFESMFELGEVYRLLNKMTNAIRAYVLACKLEPLDSDAHFRLASCYHRSGDLEGAIESYNATLEIEPGNAFAWSNLGAAYDQKGAHYDAIRSYKRSLECSTRQPIVLVNLATVYIAQERWSAARRTLETALKMAPNLSLAHERMGYCDWREQKLDTAATSYRNAIALNEKNARAHAGYGVVLMTQYLNEPGRTALREDAVESWHHSLELDPSQTRLLALVEKYRIKSEAPVLRIDQ